MQITSECLRVRAWVCMCMCVCVCVHGHLPVVCCSCTVRPHSSVRLWAPEQPTYIATYTRLMRDINNANGSSRNISMHSSVHAC